MRQKQEISIWRIILHFKQLNEATQGKAIEFDTIKQVKSETKLQRSIKKEECIKIKLSADIKKQETKEEIIIYGRGTFFIKDELKKNGFKWDYVSKYWFVKNTKVNQRIFVFE